MKNNLWKYGPVFLILLWIPLSLIILEIFFQTPISYTENNKLEWAGNIFWALTYLIILGNFYSAYRAYKIPGKMKYLIAIIWLITLPLQWFYWVFACSMSVFGK